METGKKHIKQVGADIWWAYVMKQTKAGTEFEGDMWQGPNAETLARAWFETAAQERKP